MRPVGALRWQPHWGERAPDGRTLARVALQARCGRQAAVDVRRCRCQQSCVLGGRAALAAPLREMADG
eukprot:14934553-Alexandrium_andersonii.AAC.1